MGLPSEKIGTSSGPEAAQEDVKSSGGGDPEAPCPTASSDAASDQTVPSAEDLATLRHVGGKIPAQVWTVACFSGAERFAYYALQSPLRESLPTSHI